MPSKGAVPPEKEREEFGSIAMLRLEIAGRDNDGGFRFVPSFGGNQQPLSLRVEWVERWIAAEGCGFNK
jgi:hypothetical protein